MRLTNHTCYGVTPVAPLSPTPRAPKLHPFRFLARYRLRVSIGCFFLLLTSTLALAIPYYLGRTIEALKGPSPGDVVPPLALTMGVLAVGQALSRIASRVTLFNAARMAEYDLRSKLFAHLMTLSPSYFASTTAGDLMSRLTSDVQTVRAMWGPGILNLVNTTFAFTVALILMIDIDPTLTLWAMAPFPAMIALGALFGRRIHKTSRAVQEELGALSGSIQEDLAGIAVIRGYSLEEPRKEHFRVSSERLLERNMALTRVRGQLVPVLGAVAATGTVAVLWVGGHAVGTRIDLGQLVQFNAYLILLAWPTLALGWMLSLFQRGMASWGRLRELLGTAPDIADGPGQPPERIRGDVEFRNLSVAYDGRPVLCDVSLSIRSGETVAFVGRTGSGKTTLVDTLARLVEIEPNQVFLDGHDITTLPVETVRAAIGYAPQESFLFSKSLFQNIRVGADRATDPRPVGERIDHATRAAGLTRDLSALPEGLETVVGERGITLSGGQRQRVALARAVATQPPVLILDDSLSAVDAETEQAILTALRDEFRGRTAIVISHRVAAVRAADRIFVLDRGRVVQTGTHEELVESEGTYRELYRAQVEEGAA